MREGYVSGPLSIHSFGSRMSPPRRLRLSLQALRLGLGHRAKPQSYARLEGLVGSCCSAPAALQQTRRLASASASVLQHTLEFGPSPAPSQRVDASRLRLLSVHAAHDLAFDLTDLLADPQQHSHTDISDTAHHYHGRFTDQSRPYRLDRIPGFREQVQR